MYSTLLNSLWPWGCLNRRNSTSFPWLLFLVRVAKKLLVSLFFFPSFVFLSSINIFRIVSTGNCLCQVNNYSQIFPVPLSPFSNSKRPPVFTLGSFLPAHTLQNLLFTCCTNVITICGCLHDVVNEIQCLAFHNRIRGYLSRVTYSIVSKTGTAHFSYMFPFLRYNIISTFCS